MFLRMGGVRVPGDDSSSEEDGDEQWRAAIHSVAGVGVGGFSDAKASQPPLSGEVNADSYNDRAQLKPQKLKHYQIKAHKLLNDMLEARLEMVTGPIHPLDEEDHVSNDVGVRLFKRAPPGIVFDHVEKLEGPKRKPRILPGEEVDENSKKFRKQLQCVAIGGMEILAAAEDARRKIQARLEAKEAAAKEAAKKEEQRVAELKRIRGERWLPSIAKEMKLQLKTTPKKSVTKLGNYSVST